MSKPEPVLIAPQQDELTEDSSHSREERMPAHRPATTKMVRRFEIGFFVRKVVNGWLEYYKRFPSELPSRQGQDESLDLSGLEEPPSGVATPRLLSRRAAGEGAGGGEVVAQVGAGAPTGDPGPVGGARIEVGFFAETITQSGHPDEGG